MRRVGCTNNDGGDSFALQHGSRGYSSNIAGVLVSDFAQGAQQLLEKIPAAEIINDQLVFDQRTVGDPVSRLGPVQPTVRQEPAGDSSITQQSDTPGLTGLDHAVQRASIQKRVLQLMCDHRNSRVQQLHQAWNIEVGYTNVRDLALESQATEGHRGLHIAWHRIVPPVELHEVQPVGTQPLQRAIHNALDMSRIDPAELRQIGHELRVHTRARRQGRMSAPEFADHRLDAGVDVGAVESRDAGFDKSRHVTIDSVRIYGAVITRELPAALDDPRDLIMRSESGTRDSSHLRVC